MQLKFREKTPLLGVGVGDNVVVGEGDIVVEIGGVGGVIGGSDALGLNLT